ncbi:2'-5' RNA ligase family protein [Pontibacter toksunensis]|uniref:2'-5' RNA ligase family protein n=1 Tax=Pontibacter toksunensis TaxID=1332631 RepID=A0ABW6C3E2_9BACT
MTQIRRQLTLFVSEENEILESIRAAFNPAQHQLISAHVTLCREDEIEPIEKVLANIQSLSLASPVRITFGGIQRTPDGKGVFLPSKGENRGFHQLRRAVLRGVCQLPSYHEPHITLMHPRNSTCTDERFRRLTQYELPAVLHFNKICLIEQVAGVKWNTIGEYPIADKKTTA